MSVPILNLVAVRVGPKYPRQYVEILFDQLTRNLSTFEGDVKLWCITDDPDGLPDGVTAIAHDPDLPGWWTKLLLFSAGMPWGLGERVAYFDLDIAIVGRLEDLVETPGIVQDELWPCYNSSVMVWNHGEHSEIKTFFTPDVVTAPAWLVPPECLPEGQINGGDQEWITSASTWNTFPPEWCVSYKTQATIWPPAEAKVVLFNGQPKPVDCDGWVKDVWKIGGHTSLPKMDGVNVDLQDLFDNIAANVKRDLPWFRGAWPNKHMAILVCGGPSLADSLDTIKLHKRRGARIFTVNNTLQAMLDIGIVPDAHIMVDARAENAAFIRDVDVRYFLASQCHPDVFERAADKQVTVWHAGMGDYEKLEALCAPYVDDGANRAFTPVPGGGTVGLRAMWLLFFSGYRKLRIYGLDGSYEGDKHHAYAQPLNDGEDILNVVMAGKSYRCSPWMARQASEVQATFRDLARLGMQIWVSGRGIVPDIFQAMREELYGPAPQKVSA